MAITKKQRSGPQLLDEYLEKSGVSRRSLGKELGVSHVTIGQWLRGAMVPKSIYVRELLEKKSGGLVKAISWASAKEKKTITKLTKIERRESVTPDTLEGLFKLIREKLPPLGQDTVGIYISICKRILMRLVEGQKHYGILNLRVDKRDMLQETIEEIMDALFYLEAAVAKMWGDDEKETQKEAGKSEGPNLKERA